MIPPLHVGTPFAPAGPGSFDGVPVFCFASALTPHTRSSSVVPPSEVRRVRKPEIVLYICTNEMSISRIPHRAEVNCWHTNVCE